MLATPLQAPGSTVNVPSEPAVTDGVVVGMGLHDELSGDLFAAVKTAAGQRYYVRLSSQAAGVPQEKDAVRVGVEVERWVKPADRIVSQFAEKNGASTIPSATSASWRDCGKHPRAIVSRPRQA